MTALVLRQRLPQAMEPWQTPDLWVPLTSAERQRYRLRKDLANGIDIAIVLDRARALRPGDHLVADDGRVARIIAAPERLAHIASADAQRLARAAYHLGNRHVALQVGPGWVRFAADHVLESMVAGLGFTVAHVDDVFEPEVGAYHHHGQHAPHAAHGDGEESATDTGSGSADKHANLPRQGTPFAYSPRIHEFDPAGALKRD
jgi:urease accessory protein